jgi:terminal uridylyltransferase
VNHQFVSSWLHIIGISSLLFRLKKKDSEEEKEGNEEEKDSRDLLDSRDLRCFICGDAGHVRRECPEVKMARQRNSSVAGKKR